MSAWVKIGECGVDSGQIMIVDPCYVLVDDDREEKNGYTYRELLEEWNKVDWRPLHLNVQDGVVVSSGYGDGLYPVYAKYKDGRVSAVKIDFIGEEVWE